MKFLHRELKNTRKQNKADCSEDLSLPSTLPSGGIAGKLLGQASQWGKFAGSFYWLNPSLLVLSVRQDSSPGLGKLLLVRMPWHFLLMGRGKSAIVCVGRTWGCYFNYPTCKGMLLAVFLPHGWLPSILCSTQMQPNQKWRRKAFRLMPPFSFFFSFCFSAFKHLTDKVWQQAM